MTTAAMHRPDVTLCPPIGRRLPRAWPLALDAAHPPAGHRPSPIKPHPSLSTPHTPLPPLPEHLPEGAEASLCAQLAGARLAGVVTIRVTGRRSSTPASSSLPP
jgi:hypothetical protein